MELLNRGYGRAEVARADGSVVVLASKGSAGARAVLEGVDRSELETLRANGGAQGVRVRQMPDTKPAWGETKG